MPTKDIGGQVVTYNMDTKVVQIDIGEPFFSAGKKLQWKEPSPGLGVNLEIIDFVMKIKARLVINVVSSGTKYWTSWDQIKNHMQTERWLWTAGKTTLVVIPWKETKRKIDHQETLS